MFRQRLKKYLEVLLIFYLIIFLIIVAYLRNSYGRMIATINYDPLNRAPDEVGLVYFMLASKSFSLPMKFVASPK